MELMKADGIAMTLEQFITESLDKRKAKTPAADVETRPGKGGKSFQYVKPGPVYQWLDKHYPGWSFQTEMPHTELAGFVYVIGKLTVIEPKLGITRVVSSWGCDEAIISNGSLTPVMYLKSAETDALKRCVVKLGGFNDVYGYESEPHQNVLTQEDKEWYMANVAPGVSPERMFLQISMLMQGTLTINELRNTI